MSAIFVCRAKLLFTRGGNDRVTCFDIHDKETAQCFEPLPREREIIPHDHSRAIMQARAREEHLARIGAELTSELIQFLRQSWSLEWTRPRLVGPGEGLSDGILHEPPPQNFFKIRVDILGLPGTREYMAATITAEPFEMLVFESFTEWLHCHITGALLRCVESVDTVNGYAQEDPTIPEVKLTQLPKPNHGPIIRTH